MKSVKVTARDVLFGLLFTWHFICLDNTPAFLTICWHFFSEKQTQAISSLLRAVSVSQEVLHFIFSGLKKSSHPSFCSIDFIQWSYLFVGFGGDATEGAVYIYKTHKSTIKCRGVKSPDGFSHFSVFLNACVIQKQVGVHTCLLKSSKIQ